MGRHEKVILEENFNKRERGYYATPHFVASYLARRLLMLHPDGERVFDPCVGDEELLEEFFNYEKQVDGMDVFSYKADYTCHFTQENFIDYYAAWKHSEGNIPLPYDYLIANPPYNCHEVDYIRQHKKELQALFSDVGVHNMYSMFISAMIDMAKDGAIIGLLTHDSFFTAKAHTNLRRKILEQCAIHEITMCPTDLFHGQNADVRTSILILQKGKQYQQNVFMQNRPRTTKGFQAQLQRQYDEFKVGKAKKHQLEEIILCGEMDNNELVIECPHDVRQLFQLDRLGDTFKCITGISTGNDRLYVSKEKKGKFTIPFYKNPGNNRFYADNFLYLHEDFLTFDQDISNFIVRNKSLLYQSGVACSSMGVQFTASRLPKNVTYGVNANIICDDADAWWLLAYLNSELVAYIVRGILNRSNMITSGYVSRIPLLNMTQEEKRQLAALAYEAYNQAKLGCHYELQLTSINELIYSIAQLSNATIKRIQHFNQDIVKHT